MISIYTVIIAVLVFSLLIIVHETGHYIAAKASGVKVLEFTIGFGPSIFKIKRGETLYALRLLPFGGAVVMEAEYDVSDKKKEESKEPTDTDIENERALQVNEEGPKSGKRPTKSFPEASWLSRFIITAAGSTMNYLLGFIIVLILAIPTTALVTPEIGGFMDGAEKAEGISLFQKGDVIYNINGSRINMYTDVIDALSNGEGRPYDITVIRDGEKLNFSDITLEKREYVVDGEKGLYYGFLFASREATLLDKLEYSWYTSIRFVKIVWNGISGLISGKVGVNDLSGPVGISVAIGETAKASMSGMWFFVALISINLAIMNLLPIPGLDGGRLLFMLIELVIRRPVNPKYENYIQMAGLFVLFGLMIYVTFNDIVRQFFSP